MPLIILSTKWFSATPLLDMTCVHLDGICANFNRNVKVVKFVSFFVQNSGQYDILWNP